MAFKEPSLYFNAYPSRGTVRAKSTGIVRVCFEALLLATSVAEIEVTFLSHIEGKELLERRFPLYGFAKYILMDILNLQVRLTRSLFAV